MSYSRRDFLKRGLLAVAATAVPLKLLPQEQREKIVYRIPYKNTYAKEPLVTENEFRTANATPIAAGSFEQARTIVPEPIWTGHDKEIDMYWEAWKIAVANIKAPQADSGFVSSYIDTAYNGNIFMWDSSFILMFARYGSRFFPFQKTLDNFYAKQHPDGFICREIKADGFDCFERYDPVSTGPNVMPWCEMVYFHHFGDMDRLHKIFSALCAYNKWWKINRTWPDGTYWSSGWGTGMDNIPRVKPEYSPIYSHGHMVWLDTCLQQILAGELILEAGFHLERWQEIEEVEDEINRLKKYVREKLWDEKTGFLHDRYADGTLCPTKSVAAFWALLSRDTLTAEQRKRMIAHLDDPAEFNRFHRVPSITADNPKYKQDGRYWQGGVWAPTNYMILRGLDNAGARDLSYEIAMNHYKRTFEVYQSTGTFWEYYSPEKPEPGFMARPNFVGWTGLPPIALLLENIIGLYPDYVNKQIRWDLRQVEEHGVRRYPFGPDGEISFLCAARKSSKEKPIIEIESNVDFTLVLCVEGNERKVQIVKGKQSI